LLQRIAFCSDINKASALLDDAITYYTPISNVIVSKVVRASDYHAVAGLLVLKSTKVTLLLKSIYGSTLNMDTVNQARALIDEV